MERFQEEVVANRQRGHVVVLLVDDDAAVRRAVSRLLRHFGFRVLEADSGSRALTLLTMNPDVKVVLLDQSMPTGWGPHFAPDFREATPDARLVVYSADAVSPEDRRLIDDVLVKPASTSSLVRMVDRWAGLA